MSYQAYDRRAGSCRRPIMHGTVTQDWTRGKGKCAFRISSRSDCLGGGRVIPALSVVVFREEKSSGRKKRRMQRALWR